MGEFDDIARSPPAKRKKLLDKSPANSGSVKPLDRALVIIDTDGDLKVTVGTDVKTTFKVCSKALARASPVFKAKLFGGHPVRATSNWTYHLPDDNARGLQVLFHAIHGNFDKLPSSMEFQLLYDMVVLTFDYDMTVSIRPWAARWAAGAMANPMSLPVGSRMLKHLWIAQQLGMNKVFPDLVMRVVLESTLDKEGELAAAGVKLTEQSVIVDRNLLKLACKLRAQVIGALLQGLQDAYKELSRKQPSYSSPEHCKSAMLGLLIRELAASQVAPLWPIPNPDSCRVSATELSAVVDQVIAGANDIVQRCTCDKQPRDAAVVKNEQPPVGFSSECAPVPPRGPRNFVGRGPDRRSSIFNERPYHTSPAGASQSRAQVSHSRLSRFNTLPGGNKTAEAEKRAQRCEAPRLCRLDYELKLLCDEEIMSTYRDELTAQAQKSGC